MGSLFAGGKGRHPGRKEEGGEQSIRFCITLPVPVRGTLGPALLTLGLARDLLWPMA